MEQWNDVICRLELWVDILELDGKGDFVPVELKSKEDVRTGGVYMIKQVPHPPRLFPSDITLSPCRVSL